MFITIYNPVIISTTQLPYFPKLERSQSKTTATLIQLQKKKPPKHLRSSHVAPHLSRTPAKRPPSHEHISALRDDLRPSILGASLSLTFSLAAHPPVRASTPTRVAVRMGVESLVEWGYACTGVGGASTQLRVYKDVRRSELSRRLAIAGGGLTILHAPRSSARIALLQSYCATSQL